MPNITVEGPAVRSASLAHGRAVTANVWLLDGRLVSTKKSTRTELEGGKRTGQWSPSR